MRVSLEELGRIQRKIAKTGQRYSGTSLDGALMDCDYGLEACGFSSRKITKTGDSERMVIYRCRPTWDATTVDEVIARLEESWIAHGAFRHEAHATTTMQPGVSLDFVTWWDGNSFYTGRIEVTLRNELQIDA